MEDSIRSINRKIKKYNTSPDRLKYAVLSCKESALLERFKPHRNLIIYGSLAPGESNHREVEHIDGVWKKGVIRGVLVNQGWGAYEGYLAFRHVPENAQRGIDCSILISDDLEQHWDRLDDFEGRGYLRLLASYELENGEIGIGNIYALNESPQKEECR